MHQYQCFTMCFFAVILECKTLKNPNHEKRNEQLQKSILNGSTYGYGYRIRERQVF